MKASRFFLTPAIALVAALTVMLTSCGDDYYYDDDDSLVGQWELIQSPDATYNVLYFYGGGSGEWYVPQAGYSYDFTYSADYPYLTIYMQDGSMDVYDYTYDVRGDYLYLYNSIGTYIYQYY